jgi:hypothetical protein
VRGVLADPARRTTKPGRRHLLPGMIYTDAGQRMRARPDSTRNRACYCATGSSIDAAGTEREVVARLREHLHGLRSLPRANDDAALAAQAEVERLEDQLRDLIARRQRHQIELIEYEAFAEPVRAALAEARTRTTTQRGPDLRYLARTPRDLDRRWESMTLVEKREVLAAYIERIEIRPATERSRRGQFDPERVVVTWRQP